MPNRRATSMLQAGRNALIRMRAWMAEPKSWLGSAPSPKVLAWLALTVFFLIFLKNAWVGEDAYIAFRSVEQVFDGNGPRWNPHERVQVFTSPLWFGLLCAGRLMSTDVFLNAIGASFACCLLMLIVLNKVFQSGRKLLAAVVLFACSTAFFDYTTSGLENPLAYLLIVLYFDQYRRIAERPSAQSSRNAWVRLMTWFGWLAVCRHDLWTLVLIPTAGLFWIHRRSLKPGRWMFPWGVALAPIACWSLFSLVYYGCFLPNTALAKLPYNVDVVRLFRRGVAYFLVSLRYDTATILVIGAALCLTLFSHHRARRFLAIGMCANLFYVACVGGDFMQGRFLSYGFLLAVLLVLTGTNDGSSQVEPRGAQPFSSRLTSSATAPALMLIAGLGYATAYPHTPLNSPLDYHNTDSHHGIDDGRGYYFETSSLWQYVVQRDAPVFPSHRWSISGHAFSKSQRRITTREAIGFFGYWSGTDKIIIDRLALADPLLARLPMVRWWGGQVGHFQREIPAGFERSVLSGTAALEDPRLNEFYRRLRLITQSPKLLTWERITTIVAMNVGCYDHLLAPPPPARISHKADFTFSGTPH